MKRNRRKYQLQFFIIAIAVVWVIDIYAIRWSSLKHDILFRYS